MKLLAEITAKSLGLGDSEKLGGTYELRKSARVILLNNEGLMATQYLETYQYHKLPGGGMNPNETLEETLKREVLEEVGCECEIMRPLGMTIEYDDHSNLLHISYAFVAKVVGETGQPTLEESEIKEGQKTLWIEPSELLAKMQNDTPQQHRGFFISAREQAFLREFLSL
jgi:ADP-ribose pyrophosphatase YjhB (NUDIX family)